MNDMTLLATVFGVVTALLFIKLWTIERRLTRLVRLEAKIDARLQASAIEFDELQNRLPGDVRQALDQGDTALAMRRMREATGARSQGGEAAARRDQEPPTYCELTTPVAPPAIA